MSNLATGWHPVRLGNAAARQPAPDEPLSGVTGAGHICGFGHTPRPGSPNTRQCRCGKWYTYSGWTWRPVGAARLLISGFASRDGSEWYSLGDDHGSWASDHGGLPRRLWWQALILWWEVTGRRA
jgi:hypothetical protein